MNRAIAAEDVWTAEQMEARGLSLFERASKLWPRPGGADDDGPGEDEEDEEESVSVTGTVPAVIVIRGRREEVRSWADVVKVVGRYIVDLGDPVFDRVSSEMPKFLNRDSSAFRKSSKLERLANGAQIETNLSANAILRWSRSALRIAGVNDEEWSYELKERRPAELSELQREQLAFWRRFRELLGAPGAGVDAAEPAPQHWLNLNLGRSGVCISLVCSFRDSRVGAKFMVHSRQNPGLLEQLVANRSAIEGRLGFSPEWDPHPDNLVRSIVTWRAVDLVNGRTSALEVLLGLARAYLVALAPYAGSSPRTSGA